MQIYLYICISIKSNTRWSQQEQEDENGATVDPGSHTAAARAQTGSSTPRSPAPISHFGDVCFVGVDDIWKKRGGPANFR